MAQRRLKILAEGKDVAARNSQIRHGGEQLDFRFAQAEHQARFRENLGAATLRLPSERIADLDSIGKPTKLMNSSSGGA
jgi:hypothetical protein